MIKIIIVLSFITLDFLTGIIKALKQKKLNSSEMRSGLFRKSAEVLILLFTYLFDIVIVKFSLDLPYIFNYIMIYLIIMESCSIYENICFINPLLKNKKLSSFLDKIKKESEENL